MHGMRWPRAAFSALAILSVPVWFLLLLFLLITSTAPNSVHAQVDGFVSVDCGASQEVTSGNISWTTDSTYTTLGSNKQIGNATQPPYDTLRYFPDKAITKNCYIFNTTANSSYLFRAGFFYGNYDNLSASEGLPRFVLLFGANLWANVTFDDASEIVTHEMIALATSDTASVCLGRSTNYNPFISSLEIRPLLPNRIMYSPVYENYLMKTNTRINFGQNDSESVRFPDDPYDRIWDSDLRVVTGISTYDKIVTTNESVTVTSTNDLPPSKVMQTARSPNKTENMSYIFRARLGAGQYYLSFYFAELNRTSQQQSMDVYIDGRLSYPSLNVSNVRGLHNALELFDSNYTVADANFTLLLMPDKNSTRPPFINAVESYFLQRIDRSTLDRDVQALEIIKASLNLSSWTGDPCLPSTYKWPWLECDSNSSQTRVIALNLSSMNLRSEIPPALADLSALTIVDLHNNSLYGSIPSYLANLTSLAFLDLSFNNLSGAYPVELNNVKVFRITGNPFVCVNGSCIVAPAPAPVSSPTQPSEPGSKRSRGLIVGLVVAASFVAAAVLLCMLYIRKSQKKKRLFVANSAHWPPVPPFTEISKSVDRGIPAHTGDAHDVPIFSFADVQTITNGFENKIAVKGGNGTLYYGTLPDGQEVVVKLLQSNIKQTPMEFLYKVTPLAYVNHKNLLRPIGFCAESHRFMFLYERVQKGSLYDHLHNTDKGSLDWKTRLNILQQVAQGLEHLHSSCLPSIKHGNLKSTNVLLSGDGSHAKISDYGIHELSSDVDATAGYLDPEYFTTNKLTEKSDVYSFGILILEVVCGRMPFDTSLPNDQWNILEWVRKVYDGGNHELIADASLQGTCNMSTLSKVVKLALQATKSNVDERPNMTELVMELKEASRMEIGHHVVFAELTNEDTSNGSEVPLTSSILSGWSEKDGT